jgi:hypothetical protein
VTVFDAPAVPAELKKAGIKQFAKVVANQQNLDTMKKYGVGPNSLVICAPNGDKLMVFTGDQCTQSAVSSGLKSFPAAYAAYQQRKKG